MKIHYICDMCKKFIDKKNVHVILGSKGKCYLCKTCVKKVKEGEEESHGDI